MNFKPTLIKTIGSVIGGAILGAAVKIGIEKMLGINYCPPNQACLMILNSIGPMHLFIIGGIIVVYIIWSIMQREG